MKKTISIIFCILFVFSNLTWAETDSIPSSYLMTKRVMSKAKAEYYDQVRQSIQRQVDIAKFSFLNGTIEKVQYNENGLLDSVTYSDGTMVDYANSFEDGELSSCTLNVSNGIQMAFTKDTLTIRDTGQNDRDGGSNQTRLASTGGAPSYPDTNNDIEGIKSYDPNKRDKDLDPGDGPDKRPPTNSKGDGPEGGGDGDDPGPVIIHLPPGEEWDLPKIATDPPDNNIFGLIKDATDGASKNREIAYNEYIKNTKPYYQKIYAELKQKFDSLKSKGIDLSEHFRGLSAKDLTVEEKRSLLDEAVAYIAYEAEKGEGEKIVALEFLTIEARYKEEFLELSKETYDKKIEEILEYLNGVIDKLLSSKFALYLEKKKDKIDVVIDLPKPTEKD